MIRSPTLAFIIALSASPAAAEDPRIVEQSYDPGMVVRIEGRAQIQATVQFAENEHIENVAIGDSQSWQVTPNKRASLLFVKPTALIAKTNMTVVTDRRTYLFDLVASPGAKPLYILRFTYPDEAAVDPGTRTAKPQQAVTETPGGRNPYAIVDPATLNFAWRAKGDKRLLPARIYDDGSATFLTWPEGRSMPAILMKDAQGSEGPVNFAARDDMIVIDGVPTELVLRAGKDSASLVNTRPALRGQAHPQISLASLTAEEGPR